MALIITVDGGVATMAMRVPHPTDKFIRADSVSS
jgi:hypothetical protein